MLFGLLIAGTAQAGSGPWVIGSGSRDAFFALESQRLTKLSIQTAADKTEEVDVGEGLTTIGAKGIFTYGVRPRMDLTVAVPWYRVQANRTDHELCDALGLGACQTTQGIGIISVSGKGLLLDELYGSPVSLSVGGEARYGAFTAADRERITNIGEGTFDIGPIVAIGRSIGTGTGYSSALIQGGYRYRFVNTDGYPGASSGVPGGEVFGDSSVLWAPSSWLAVGPTVSGLWRPGGLDWYELDLTDTDRFSALRIYNVRAGGMVIVRTASPDNSNHLAFTFGALRTIASMNNPTDVTLVSIGLSINQPAGS
ncbi:MAG: hypothetical protein ACI8RZ_002943 [Myxococcota bacterium]|jgi:hypothetical protein